MRHGANLNIIIKAIEKATAKLPRDFSEIENLQTNPAAAVKFANICYSRVKEGLIEDLTKLRPEYNIHFSDGQKIIHQENSEYRFVVFPVDGVSALSRAIPDFTVAVALEHVNQDNIAEPIAVAVNKIIGNEVYYAEKGFGAYLNNRRIRVSKRGIGDVPFISVDDYSYLTQEIKEELKLKSFALRNYGCRTLDVSYLASARFDLAFVKNWNYEYLKPFFLLVREAGGVIFEREKFSLLGNNIINFTS